MVVVTAQVKISKDALYKRMWRHKTTRSQYSPVEVVLLGMGHFLELQLSLFDVHFLTRRHDVDDSIEGIKLRWLGGKDGGWLGGLRCAEAKGTWCRHPM